MGKNQKIGGALFVFILLAAIIVLSNSLVITKENEYSLIKGLERLNAL